MRRAAAILLGVLLLAVPAQMEVTAQQVPDPISRSELGTVRSEGGTDPNADASTRFYGYAAPATTAANTTYNYGKIQFEVKTDPDANDWAIEQAGKAGQGATRICQTAVGTTADCNYVSRGKNSRHLFGNGAGAVAEFGFRDTGAPPTGDDADIGYSRGWVKLTGRNDAVAEIAAAGTASVALELTTKGGNTEKNVITLVGGDDGGLATFASGGAASNPFVFTTGAGFSAGSLVAGFGGIRVEGQRKHIVVAPLLEPPTAADVTYNVTSPEAGAHLDNYGALGNVTFQLPIAVTGNNYCFSVAAAFPVIVRANAADKIAISPTNSATGGALSSSALFSSICIVARRPTQWMVYATVDKTQWSVVP